MQGWFVWLIVILKERKNGLCVLIGIIVGYQQLAVLCELGSRYVYTCWMHFMMKVYNYEGIKGVCIGMQRVTVKAYVLYNIMQWWKHILHITFFVYIMCVLNSFIDKEREVR